jgi:hypothetical protein
MIGHLVAAALLPAETKRGQFVRLSQTEGMLNFLQ